MSAETHNWQTCLPMYNQPSKWVGFFISKLGRFFYKEIFTFMIIQSLFGRFITLFASKIYVDDHANFKNITYLNMLFKVFWWIVKSWLKSTFEKGFKSNLNGATYMLGPGWRHSLMNLISKVVHLEQLEAVSLRQLIWV